jgi:hypothetical protein
MFNFLKLPPLKNDLILQKGRDTERSRFKKGPYRKGRALKRAFFLTPLPKHTFFKAFFVVQICLKKCPKMSRDTLVNPLVPICHLVTIS